MSHPIPSVEETYPDDYDTKSDNEVSMKEYIRENETAYQDMFADGLQ